VLEQSVDTATSLAPIRLAFTPEESRASIRRALLDLLEAGDGPTAAARALGVSRMTVYRIIYESRRVSRESSATTHESAASLKNPKHTVLTGCRLN
jgi:transposase-like protein